MPVETIDALRAELFRHFVRKGLPLFGDAAACAGRDFGEVVNRTFRDLLRQRLDRLFVTGHRDAQRIFPERDFRLAESFPAPQAAVFQLLEIFLRLFGQQRADNRFRQAARDRRQNARAGIPDKGAVRCRGFQHPEVDGGALDHHRRFARGEHEHVLVRLHLRGRDDDHAGLFPVAERIIILLDQSGKGERGGKIRQLLRERGIFFFQRRFRSAGRKNQRKAALLLFPCKSANGFRHRAVHRRRAVRDDVRPDHAQGRREFPETVLSAGEPEIFPDRNAHRRRDDHRDADVLFRLAQHSPCLLHRRHFIRDFSGSVFRFPTVYPILHSVPPCRPALSPRRGLIRLL